MTHPPTFSRHPGPNDRHFLEMLCLLRGLYAHRGSQDRLAVIAVDEAILSAELLLQLRRVRDERLMRRFIGAPRSDHP